MASARHRRVRIHRTQRAAHGRRATGTSSRCATSTPGLEAFVRGQQARPRAASCGATLTSAAAVARAGARRAAAFDACLYLAANGDPATSAERPAWDLDARTRSRSSRSSSTSGRSLRLRVVRRRVRRPARRRVAGDAGGAAAAVRDLEARVRALRPVRSPSGSKTIGSYVNVRFFGAYGPYEPAAQDHDAVDARCHGRASASSRFAATARTSSTSCTWTTPSTGFCALTSAAGYSGDGRLRFGLAGQRQRRRADDGEGARRRRDDPARRRHRGIHPVPLRRPRPCAIDSASRRRFRSRTACGGWSEFSIGREMARGQPA